MGSVFTYGTHNAITASGVFTDLPTTVTFVPVSTEKTDLATLIPDAEPGDFAIKYGLATIWQWDGTEWQGGE